MENLLQLFILVPFLAFIISLLLSPKKEIFISSLAIGTVGVHLLGVLVFIGLWATNGFPTLDIRHISLYKTDEIDIFINFYFDKITAIFALIGSILTLLVAIFSRFYMHRDEGFKRYFNTLLLFFLGYNLTIFSGNFETLFTGWEILGVCSFLLIAYYRDRYLPVKNALKVISLYRLGDICLILAMWMSHHTWHKNITFSELNNANTVLEHFQAHGGYGIFIALMIVIAAAAKSAQIPFSTWLPRAMEGPTTSSAIFYGSLSVHLGAFLLLRTFPYWESLTVIKAVVIGIGLTTSLVATSIARVQSSVKTQIAYASITQIGLIFIEIALGFHNFALLHFAGNAFLRTYQLLVSPSVLGYLIHDMFFTFTPPQYNGQNPGFFNKMKNTVYLLSIKEWHLDTLLHNLLWKPFKWVGKNLDFLSNKIVIGLLGVLFLVGISSNLFHTTLPADILHLLPFIFAVLGFLFVLKAFAERGEATQAWLFVVAGQLFITLSTALLNEHFGVAPIVLYLSGVITCAVIGFICLKKLKSIDNNINLNQFHGYSYEQPKLSFWFLVACLGLVGLPFTPTFLGIDVLFSHIEKHETVIIIFTALSFVFIELSILRIYARVCMGQHKKAYHPIAFRSS
jgi:NADH-quinone oxidoreductase subunit L